MDPTTYLLAILGDLVWTTVKGEFKDLFKKKRVEMRVEGQIKECIGELADSLDPFFRDEKLGESAKITLVDTCAAELKPLLKDPAKLLHGALDGKTIYRQLYPEDRHPPAIENEQLGVFYAQLFPRVAHLVCRIPGVVAKWEKEVWSEHFRQMIDLREDVARVEKRVEEAGAAARGEDDDLFLRLRKNAALEIALKVDITSLHDRDIKGARLEEIFVAPDLTRTVNKKTAYASKPEEVVASFLSGSARSIIMGSPGSGKTTWAVWLETLALKSDDIVPIRIRLRAEDPAKPRFIDQLIKDVAGGNLSALIEPKNLAAWVKAGRFGFIIDGFDEISPGHRDTMLRWIISLAGAAPKSPILITSRPLTTDHLDRLSREWRRWEIQPFNEPRISDYITRWYACTPAMQENEIIPVADELAKKWADDPTISPLTGNPLMLGTILMVNRLDGSLPDGRAKLYRRYVEGMLGIWDDRRGIPVGAVVLKMEQKHRILTRIALRLHLRNEDQIGDTELVPLIGAELKHLGISAEPTDVLDQLRERSGLLIGPGTYNFVHKSVGEFLVAQAIDDGSAHDENEKRLDRWRLWEERHNDRWNTVLFLWAGLCKVSELEDFIEDLIEQKGDDNLLLAMGLLYDQWTKLGPIWPAERFARALEFEFHRTIDRHRFRIGFDGEGFGHNTESVYLGCRGIAQLGFGEMLLKLIAAERIEWRHLRMASPVFRSNMWTLAAWGMTSHEQLAVAMSDHDFMKTLSTGFEIAPFYYLHGLL